MKEGFDREIDSLLRRRARGTAESRPWDDGAGNGSTGSHLDADELNAFAEGALPAAARVSAASHLADCDRCRGVVVGLARVAEAVAEAKLQALAANAKAEPARPSAWRALLASLFSPRAMRFAVPVLALSLVGVVSYIALRSDKGSLQTAREARSNAELQSAPSASVGLTAADANANTTLLNANAAPSETPSASVPQGALKGHGAAEPQTTEATAGETASGGAAAQPATEATSPPPPPPPSAAAPAAPVEGPREVSKAAPKSADTETDEVARSDKEKTESRDNKSARGSEPSDDALANEAQMAQRRAQPRNINEPQMPDGSRNQSQKRAADNNIAGGYSGGGNAATAAPPRDADRAGSRSETFGRGRTATRRAERKAEETEDGAAGETRTAAGHRFRREGGAWIDVNYKSNMRSTGVRRGTEAYRALVADVPEVGRVAEAISGEVIVVVGGRAYRIQ